MGEEATRHRARVARCMVLRSGLPDIQHVAKEKSHWMSSPCWGDHEHSARIGKCLKIGFLRVEQMCPSGKDDSVVCAPPTRIGQGVFAPATQRAEEECCVSGCA